MAVSLPPGVYRRDIAQKLPAYVCVGTNTALPDGLAVDTTSNSLNSRMGMTAPAAANVTDLVLAFPQFATAVPEVDFGVTYTVKAAVEYPAGTFTPVYTETGSRSLTVSPGRGLVAFQPCPIMIPAGARYWVKTYASWTPGNFQLARHAASWVAGDGTQRGTGLADNTLVAGTPTTTSNDGFGPIVYGRLDRPTAVLGIIGDSISQTATEQGDPVTNWSFLERAMRGIVPVLNTARNSDRALDYTNRPDGRTNALRDRITHLIWSMGRNDCANGSETLMRTTFQKAVNPWLARGVRVYANTVTPYTTSTDGWISATNQTIVSNREACRQDYNAWLRANWKSLGISGLYDWAHVVDPSDSGKWSFDSAGTGRGAQGFSSISGGALSSVIMGQYLLVNNSGGTDYGFSTTTPCAVLNYPGTPGSGAQVTGNTSSLGLVTSYTITNPGSGYTYPPMVSPMGAWVTDGIHPSARGYDMIISQCGIRPETFVL